MNYLEPTENLKYCNDAIALKEKIEDDFLTLGEYLHNIKEHSLFEPQWSSFIEFCFELKMSQNTINKLIQIYKVFVLDYGIGRNQITNAGVSLVTDILPVINTKKDALKWLGKASLLTRQDLRRELIEHKTGVDMTKCKHEDTYVVEICRDCGERKQINNETR